MQNSPNLLGVTLRSIRDAVVTTDASARVLTLNPAAEELTGWAASDAVGVPVERVVDLRQSGGGKPMFNPAYACLRDAARAMPSGPALLLGKDGQRTAIQIAAHPVEDSSGKVDSCVLIFYDLNDALRLAERIAYQAQHDPLTGLPNRILLVDRMEQAARIADRQNEQLAVLFVDLDRFTGIEGSYSAALADDLLKEAASRLSDALRESDTVCRLGRDEFIVLLPSVKTIDHVVSVAAKLVSEAARPYELGEHTLQASCSVGISLYPKDASDSGTLIRLADQAMQQAKLNGRNQYLFAKPNDDAVPAVQG